MIKIDMDKGEIQLKGTVATLLAELGAVATDLLGKVYDENPKAAEKVKDEMHDNIELAYHIASGVKDPDDLDLDALSPDELRTLVGLLDKVTGVNLSDLLKRKN